MVRLGNPGPRASPLPLPQARPLVKAQEGILVPARQCRCSRENVAPAPNQSFVPERALSPTDAEGPGHPCPGPREAGIAALGLGSSSSRTCRLELSTSRAQWRLYTHPHGGHAGHLAPLCFWLNQSNLVRWHQLPRANLMLTGSFKWLRAALIDRTLMIKDEEIRHFRQRKPQN